MRSRDCLRRFACRRPTNTANHRELVLCHETVFNCRCKLQRHARRHFCFMEGSSSITPSPCARTATAIVANARAPTGSSSQTNKPLSDSRATPAQNRACFPPPLN
eukprot:NODE_18009_length_915_cov_8.025381.p3 GENE.NODE_18009_length_915_cov_8.025381~~NODE_18009_length_915_cov_8.025381.p3  ORF type:complete len:105 (-),score=2.65 NODE_18009_length_915_cov_8.025381:420-734(-)